MKKYLSKIFYGIFLLLLVAVASLTLMPLLPTKDNIEIKIVKSGSMEPAIKTGSIVVIKPAELYQIGDVITFGEDSPDSFPTTHRIVSISDSAGAVYYQVKGDANEEADPALVPKSDVIGKVIFSVPSVGYVIDFARQPIGFILLIAFPGVLLILNELIDIGREVRKVLRRRKKEPPSQGYGEPREKILKRLYQMDDVLRPVYLVRHHEVRKTQTKSPLIASILILFAAGITFTGSNGTISYFNDIETSVGNLLHAGSLDFSVALALGESSDIKLTPGEPQVTIIPTVTGGAGDFPLAYRVHVEQTGGNSPALCAAIDLFASSTPFTYSNKLMAFTYGTTTNLNPLSLSLSLPPGGGFTPTDTCLVDVIYSGWVNGGVEGIGYSDIERVSLSIIDPPAENVPVVESPVVQEVVSESIEGTENSATTTEETPESSSSEDETIAETEIVEEVVEEEEVASEVEEEVSEPAQELSPESETTPEVVIEPAPEPVSTE